MQMERGVIVIDGVYEPTNRDLCRELLANLARKRLLGRFTRLDLTAGELPSALELAVAALRRKHAAIALDHRGHHFNGLHALAFRMDAFASPWDDSTYSASTRREAVPNAMRLSRVARRYA